MWFALPRLPATRHNVSRCPPRSAVSDCRGRRSNRWLAAVGYDLIQNWCMMFGKRGAGFQSELRWSLLFSVVLPVPRCSQHELLDMIFPVCLLSNLSFGMRSCPAQPALAEIAEWRAPRVDSSMHRGGQSQVLPQAATQRFASKDRQRRTPSVLWCSGISVVSNALCTISVSEPSDGHSQWSGPASSS